MWKPFIKAIKEFIPNAELVHDRFHLIKYLNESMDTVRRREVVNEELLKESRYVLLKNEAKLSEKQKEKFELINASNLEVTKVWHIRENFKSLFGKSHNDKDAENLLVNWAQNAFMYGIQEVNLSLIHISEPTRPY